MIALAFLPKKALRGAQRLINREKTKCPHRLCRDFRRCLSLCIYAIYSHSSLYVESVERFFEIPTGT